MRVRSSQSTQRGEPSFVQTNIGLQPMTLEERKAFRRELLYRAIRQGMKSLEAVSSMYKFKIINVDARHHRFIALIEVTSSFNARIGSTPQSFPKIEAFLRNNAFEQFGLMLERVFWRVSESEKVFERRSREGDPAPTAATAQASGKTANAGRTGSESERLARMEFSQVTDQELADFVRALKAGRALPAVTIGDHLYVSDRVPLDDKSSSDDPPETRAPDL